MKLNVTGGRPKEEDWSPPEIQAIRKAFIEQFMRSGMFDNVMHQKLLAYAITQRPPDYDDRSTDS